MKQRHFILVSIVGFSAIAAAQSPVGITHIESSQADGVSLVTYASLTNATTSSRYYCSGDPLKLVSATQARDAAQQFLDGLVQSKDDWALRGIQLRCFRMKRVEEVWLKFWHWQVLFVDTMYKSKDPYLSASEEERKRMKLRQPRLSLVVDMKGEVVPPEEK